jgi:cysteine synthase
MLDPTLMDRATWRSAQAAFSKDPLNRVNLYNITWKSRGGKVDYVILPKELTGVDANIVVMSGRNFPTGSHKVGAVYSILIEKQVQGEVDPGKDTIVCPSTGNYGIGGAWVGPRMGYRCLVVLPKEMSRERFVKIRGYGADIIATPGSESNVKEIFDKVKELRADKRNKILEQFSEFGNYRFHYYVTGNTVIEMAGELKSRGIGDGKVAAFVSAMGSAGTIAAGDRIKEEYSSSKIVGLEPVQCPTLYSVGFGAHRIEGIGDKHVTWIHNVRNMDYLMCIDDLECLKGLQLLQEGRSTLVEAGVSKHLAERLVGYFGVSGVCNILGAIKAAKLLGLKSTENVFTVATDSFDRYPSVLAKLNREVGRMSEAEADRRLAIFRDAKLDYVLEGTREVRQRWHNQKYFTWVEQQGKTVEELNAQADVEFWRKQAAAIKKIDAAILAKRK